MKGKLIKYCCLVLFLTALLFGYLVEVRADSAFDAGSPITITDSSGNTQDITSGFSASVSGSGSYLITSANSVTYHLNNTGSGKADITITGELTHKGNTGSATINGTTFSTGMKISLEAGKSVEIKITSGKKSSSTTTLKLTAIEYSMEVSATASFKTADNGSYTAAGTAITTDQQMTVTGDGKIELVATPASGYEFYAWRELDSSGKWVVIPGIAASGTLTVASDKTIQPLFVKTGSALFYVNGYIYAEWNDAFTAAETLYPVVLYRSGTLAAGKYTIGAGQKFLVPFNKEFTADFDAEPTNTLGYTKPTQYSYLTLQEGAVINCYGSINVNASQAAASSFNTGSVSGPYGQIIMNAGSQINLLKAENSTSAGTLYAYGYITGSGTVTAESGTSIYEFFQITDWRGGTTASKMVDKWETEPGFSFLISQFYVQNIEAKLVVKSGATVHVCALISATVIAWEAAYPCSLVFIGSEGGLFRLGENGVLTRTYSAGRSQYSLSGTGTLSSIELSLNGVDMNSANYVLNIPSNLSIVLEENASVSTAVCLKLLPHTVLEIKKNATLTLQSGAALFLYDYEDWTDSGFVADTSGTKGYFMEEYLPCVYSPSGTCDIGYDSKKVPGQLKVNGTLDIQSGAAVYSTNYDSALGAGNDCLSGTGKIKWGAAPTTPYTEITEIQSNNASGATGGNDSRKTVRVPVVLLQAPLAGVSASSDDFTKSMNHSATYYGTGDFWYQWKITVDDANKAGYVTPAEGYVGTDTTAGDAVIAYICSGGTMSFTVNGYNVSTNSGTVDLSAEPTSSTAAYKLSGMDENVTLSLSDPHKTQMVLGASLDMRFALPKAYFTNITSITINGETYSNDLFTAVGNNISDYCYVICSGIAAKDMGKEFTFVIHYADGSSSPAYTESIQSYAERMLKSDPYKSATAGADYYAKVMLVDMLNYGAAADMYFKKTTSSTINSYVTENGLTGTTDQILADTVGALPENAVPAALRLGSTIELLFKFEGATDAAYARVEFDSHWGENYGQIYRVDNLTMDNDAIVVAVDRLLVADASQPVTVQLYDKDGGVLKTVTGSIKDYLQRIYSTEEDGSALKNLCVEIMRFSKSTYDFLHARYPQPNTGESAG